MTADSMERLITKTPPQQFVRQLERAYGLAPRVAQAVLEEARQYLTPPGEGPAPGQLRVVLSPLRNSAGRPLRACALTTVSWTVDAGAEDYDVLARHGARALRQVRVQRLLDEAVEQGAVASQEDVARVLHVSVRTIKRDCAELEGRGVYLPTRGHLQGMGRGQTHKALIVGRWLNGETYDQLAQHTHHSASSIQRYVQTFVRVVQLARQGFSAAQIAQVVQAGAALVQEYLAVDQAHDSAACRERLAEHLQRVGRAGDRLERGAP